MLAVYRTIKSYGSSEVIIQKSRFIAYINRVESEGKAQAFIQEIKKKHWDATHNCSAYMIGEHNQIQKANDDGEPAGTAGVPILEVIKKKDLKDTVIVVTRYFGGIKLGAGGLIRTYGSSASLVIEEIGIVECRLMQIVYITIDYHLLGKVENELRNANYIINDIQFTDKVIIETMVEKTNKSTYLNWLMELTNGKLTVSEGDLTYYESQC